MEQTLIYAFYFVLIFVVLLTALLLRVKSLANSDDLQQAYQSIDIAFALDIAHSAPSSEHELDVRYPIRSDFGYVIDSGIVAVSKGPPRVHPYSSALLFPFTVEREGTTLVIHHET